MTSLDSQQILYVLDLKGDKADGRSDEKHGRIATGRTTGEGHLRTLINHEHLPDGIDVLQHDGDNGRMYWTQMGTPDKNDGRIQSAALDGSDVQDIFAPGEIHTPKQIIIDRINRKLYEVLVKRGDWRDPSERENKDIQCVGIAVDAKHGRFYWTQKGPPKGGSGKIYRANIDMPAGKTAETRDDIELVFRDLPEPIDLEIESDTQTLYWSDRGEEPRGNTLNKADVSGQPNPGSEQRSKIIAKSLHEAIGIRIDSNSGRIYASDLGGSIYAYDHQGNKLAEMYKNEGSYTGVAIANVSAAKTQQLYGMP